MSLMPHVNEVNAISHELSKDCIFEIVLVCLAPFCVVSFIKLSAAARGLKKGRTEAKVRMIFLLFLLLLCMLACLAILQCGLTLGHCFR